MSKIFQVRNFYDTDQSAVEELVLVIQRDEFGLALSVDNQPDLKNILAYFSEENSAFWVATTNTEQVIGCIGYQSISNQVGVMRKFMVHRNWRGAAGGVAQALNAIFEQHARQVGATQLALSTVDATKAAQAFYKRCGYARVDRSSMPKLFVPGALDSVFFVKNLN